MKKFYMTAVAMILAVCIHAQELTKLDVELGNDYVHYIIPSLFTYGHKICIEEVPFAKSGATSQQVRFYNKDFECFHTINPTNKAMAFEIYDGETGNCFNEHTGVHFTQTLFNNDEKFEYLSLTDARDAIRIMSEDGECLCSITPESGSGYTFYEAPDVYIMGKTCYLVCPIWQAESYSNEKCIVYRIDPTTSSVKRMENVQLAIRPNVVDRSSMVTVELDDTDTARELVVTGMDGRIVERRDIPAGERQIQVPAARMASGMYNFTIRKRGTVEKNGKVIVK